MDIEELEDLIPIPSSLQQTAPADNNVTLLSDDCSFGWENCQLVCQTACNTSAEGCTGCQTCQNSCETGTSCQTACQITSQCGESSLISPTWSLSATTDTITATITNRGSYSYFSWSLRDANNNILSEATQYSTATSKTYSGLAPSTTYIVYMSYSRSTAPEGNYDSDSITTDEVSGVAPWSWNASNGTASAVQTRTAYNAVSNYGPISDFSYLVWNDMVAKVAEMRNRANQKPVWNTKYLTQANTSMSNTESGRTMTAARYNSLRYNIGLYYGFNEVPSGELIDLNSVTKEKVPGDPVIGSDFIDLTTCLNYAIDRANNS